MSGFGMNHPVHVPSSKLRYAYRELEDEYNTRRRDVVPFDYQFLINFGRVAFREGHIRRGIELSREALAYAGNAHDHAYVYLVLSRGYRMMIQMQNAEAELKRAFRILGVAYPRPRMVSLIKVLPALFLRLSIIKNYQGTLDETITADKKILIELYEEAALCAYYMRYPSLLLFQFSLRVRKLVCELGPSIEMVNYFAATATAFGIHRMPRFAYTYLGYAKKVAENINERHVLAKYLVWEALTYSYLGRTLESSSLFKKLIDEHSVDLAPYELRLACTTLSTSSVLRGKQNESLWAVDQMITDYDKQCDHIFSCAKTFIEWNKIPALCYRGNLEEAERILINSRTIFSSVDNEKWQIILFLGNVLIYHYLAVSTKGDEIQNVFDRFKAVRLSPQKTFLEAYHYWIVRAYLHIHFCIYGEAKPSEALSAIRDVHQITQFDVVQSHMRVLEGYAAFLRKRYATARRLIPYMFSMAQQTENDWALYEAMKLDMLLTIVVEGKEAGQSKYVSLESWLTQKDLKGFLPNLQKSVINYI